MALSKHLKLFLKKINEHPNFVQNCLLNRVLLGIAAWYWARGTESDQIAALHAFLAWLQRFNVYSTICIYTVKQVEISQETNSSRSLQIKQKTPLEPFLECYFGYF